MLRRKPGPRRLRIMGQRHAKRLPKGLKPIRPGELVQIDTLFVNVAPDKAVKHFTAYDPVAKWTVALVAGRATARCAAALLDKLIADGDLYEIASSDFGVNTPLSRRFPDVLVEPASHDGKGRTSESPIFIAEVMSPSTVTVDRKKKPAEYATLASLQTYAVFSQDEPTVWVWQRSESGLPERPTRLEGREARLDIPALGTSLPLPISTAASALKGLSAWPRRPSG